MAKVKQPLWYKILVAFAIFKVGVDKDFRKDTFVGYVKIGDKRYSA